MRPRWWHAVCALTLLLAGCAALRSPPDVRTYRLAYPPPEPAGTAPLPVTLRVIPFGIAAAYDQQAFIYRSGPYDTGFDYYNRWIANPASMISDLIARDLAASHAVQAVLQAPSALPADYELNGQVETLEERDDGGACTAHLRLRVILVRVPPRAPRRVVMQDSFAADEPCPGGSAEAYAEAMSRAVQRISDQVRAAVLSAITTERDTPA